jgi:hypothetical protein
MSDAKFYPFADKMVFCCPAASYQRLFTDLHLGLAAVKIQMIAEGLKMACCAFQSIRTQEAEKV